MRKPFLTGYKRHKRPGFKILIFLNFSVYTTLSEPKQPTSIKNFVHCGASQSRRAISGLFSFFIHPVYIILLIKLECERVHSPSKVDLEC